MVEAKTRGGARPNAGRKRKNDGDKVITVSFCCTPEQKEKIRTAAKESGRNMSDYILNKLL